MDNDREGSTRGQGFGGAHATTGRAASLVDPDTHAEPQILESQSTDEATRKRGLEVAAERLHVESLPERIEGLCARWPSETHAGKLLIKSRLSARTSESRNFVGTSGRTMRSRHGDI